MGNTVLGVVAPLPQGAWNSTTTYQKLSVVREGNSSYIAKSANVNIQPGVTDSWETYWMLLNEDGDTGQQGPQGATGVGVPDGGLEGYILVKRSQANYDDEWVDPANITVGNATKAVQDENGNNIADTYQTKQDSTTQNTALQTQITSNTQGITQNSQLISRNSARLTNVEQRISPSPFVTDSTVAYVKDVPANALPYAELQKLGGMTRKCTNLIDINKRLYGVIDSNGDLVCQESTVLFYNYDFEANTQYTLSGYVKNENTTGKVRFLVNYTDGTGSGALLNATTEWLYKTFTTEPDKTVANISLTYGEQGAMYIKGGELMLNEGATALPYEPYFEGLRSAPVTSVESVGANLLNMSKFNGGSKVINADGSLSITSGNSAIYPSAILTGVLPSGTYNLTNISGNSCYVMSSTSDYSNLVGIGQNKSFAYDGSSYLEIRYLEQSANTTVTYKAMLNKGTTSLPYTPYTKPTLPIPESVRPANGINDTVYDFIEWDANGNVKSQKSVGVADLGSLYWVYWQNGTFYTDSVPKKNGVLNMLTSKYTTAAGLTNGKISGNESNKNIYITDTDYTDVASFKASLSGVMLYYELATPEVTDISALITADNLLPVEGNGTITFVNEYGYAVPSTVEYMT